MYNGFHYVTFVLMFNDVDSDSTNLFSFCNYFPYFPFLPLSFPPSLSSSFFLSLCLCLSLLSLSFPLDCTLIFISVVNRAWMKDYFQKYEDFGNG